MYMRGEVHMSLSLCDSCDSPISPVFFGPRVRSIRFGPTTRGIQPQFVGDRHPRCDPAIASIAAVEPWPSQSATFQPGNMAIWWPKGPFFSPSPALKTKVSQKTKSKWFSLGRSCWTVSWGFLCCRTSKQLLSRSASWATQSFACQEVVGELVVFLVQKWLQFPPLCFSDHEPMECRPWRHQFAVGTCSHKPLQSQISSNLCLSCRWGGQQIIQGAPTQAWSKVSLSHMGDPMLATIKHGNVWKVGIFTAQVETCTNLPTHLKTQSSEHQSHRCLLYQLRLWGYPWAGETYQMNETTTRQQGETLRVMWVTLPLPLSNQKEALTNLQVCLSVYLYAPNESQRITKYISPEPKWVVTICHCSGYPLVN